MTGIRKMAASLARPIGWLALVVVCPTFALTAAAAEPAATLTPDQSTLLVSRDIGGLRWTILQDLETGAVTGNVYDLGGGEPRFVWCAIGAVPEPNISFSCSGATSCETEDCSQDWQALDGAVEVPMSSFRAGTFQATLETLRGRWSSGGSDLFATGVTFTDLTVHGADTALQGRLDINGAPVFVTQAGDGVTGFQFDLLDDRSVVLATSCPYYRFNQIGPDVLWGVVYSAFLRPDGSCAKDTTQLAGGFTAVRRAD
mgnify:CR=1 FL=1